MRRKRDRTHLDSCIKLYKSLQQIRKGRQVNKHAQMCLKMTISKDKMTTAQFCA